MWIHIKLYSILHEKLPPEDKGEAQLELADNTTLAELLVELDIGARVVISVNEQHETNQLRQLRDGDTVRIFSSISSADPLPLSFESPLGGGGSIATRTASRGSQLGFILYANDLG